jgi:hypothetical protein
MTPRARTGATLALFLGVLVQACQRPADPEQVRTVDTLIASVESAMLALNELDTARYRRCDSLYRADHTTLEQRFRDTLERGEAGLLGNHYLLMRAAARMGQDHATLESLLRSTVQRLRALRTDIASGAMDPRAAAPAIATEKVLLTQLEADTHRAFDNYRSLQRAWDQRHQVAQLMGDANPILP